MLLFLRVATANEFKPVSFFFSFKFYFNSERSEADPGSRGGEAPEVRPVCKALGYWDDKIEEKFLRTTTDDGRSK